MSGGRLEELALERHLRRLERGLGTAALAACDPAGAVVAGAGATGELASLLGGLGAEARAAQAGSPQACRVELPDGRVLLQAPLVGNAGEAAAWLAALCEVEDAEACQRAATELDDAAELAGVELRLRAEVDGLVGDLTARHEELNLVYEFARRGGALMGPKSGAQELLETIARDLDVDVAALIFPGRELPVFAARDPSQIRELDLLLTQLAGDVFRFVSIARRPLLINEPDDPRRQYLMAGMPYRVLACPVMSDHTSLATLALVRLPGGVEFSNSDRNLANAIASQTALIVRDRERIDQLASFSADMAAALIEAIEAKDPYTRGHSERVQSVSVELGRAADLHSQDVEDISWGALLHDVGKIGVPDSILCKRGKLTEDEYTLIKIHPERSYEILKHVAGLSSNVLDAARYHQEKYDGTGYPHGLRGTQIPLHARVVAIADCYDAITSSRAYRAASAHEIALARIRKAAGKQLDPQFVSVFEKLCETRPAWAAPGPPGEGGESD